MRMDRLLEQFETLPYGERIKRMVLLTRSGKETTLIQALETGNFYQRWLALMSCYGDENGARALRLLSDRSQMIRRSALHLVARYGNEAEVLIALDMTLPILRRNLILTLQRLQRQPIIDACIQYLAALPAEIESLTDCLPHATPELVRRYLPTVQTRMLIHHWARLARLHPDIVLAQLPSESLSLESIQLESFESKSESKTESEMEQAELPDPTIMLRFRAALPFLANTHPHEALKFLRSLSRHLSLCMFPLERLARRLPTELTDLILAKKEGVPCDMALLLPRLDADRVMALLDASPSQARDMMLSIPRRLAPVLRDRIYLHFSRAWEDKAGSIDVQIISYLSRELREREARRHIHLPSLKTRPQQRLPYAAYLPWEEAMETLRPPMHDSDPEIRNLAHGGIAKLVRYQRERLPHLLALHIAYKHEQDPIRLTMVIGLADLPPCIWKPDHLDLLQQIVRNALDASDLSLTTVSQLQRMIVRIFPFYPYWSAEQFALILHERGSLMIPLGDSLSNAEVSTLNNVLLPVLQGWRSREEWGRLIQFANNLGRRLRVCEELVTILEEIVVDPATGWMAERALGLIALHHPQRMARLVPTLVTSDPSWATRHIVYTYLHASRQDLLTPFLGCRAYKGRFATGKTRFILPFGSGFVRWTAHQQEIFAQLLAEVLQDNGRDTPGYITILAQLAALPCPQPTALIAQARLDNNKPALMETTLRALAKLDGGEGIPILVEALSDVRSRTAIYALRGALLIMPRARALTILKSVLMNSINKVTVMKETVRLIGDLKTDAAYTTLFAIYEKDLAKIPEEDSENSGQDEDTSEVKKRGLHRDVKVALLRALWGFLNRDESWQPLKEAAVSPDTAIASHVVRVPAEGLTSEAEGHLIETFALLLIHPDARVRLLALQRCHELPILDRQQRLFPHILAAIGSDNQDEREAGGIALLHTYTKRDLAQVEEAVRGLLPNRRALRSLLDQLIPMLQRGRSLLLPTAGTVLRVLRTDAHTACLIVQLAFHSLATDTLIALLLEMADTRTLHADALEMTFQVMRVMPLHRRDMDLEVLETTLGGHSDRYVRRLALEALITVAARTTGWTPERLERLEVYRRDSATLVADAAQFTFP